MSMRLRFSAWREFAAHYAKVFRGYWDIRAQLDPPVRSQDELAFLPAHLELVESLVSAKPRLAMHLIIAMFFVALLWAAFGRLDIVAVAPGQTVPGGRTKTIQPLEASVVKAIHVRDGQRVKAGYLLIELDSAITEADVRKSGDALESATLGAARYAALIDAVEKNRPPQSPFTVNLEPPFAQSPSKGASPDPRETGSALVGSASAERSQSRSLTPAQITAQTRLIQSEYGAYLAKRDAAESQLAQRTAELATTRELITHLVDSDRIATARAADVKRLLGKDFVSRHEYLTAEQARISAEQDLATQRSRINELEAAISTGREARDTVTADFRASLLDGLRQAEEQIAQFSEDATKSQRRDALMRLTAPVTGTVQQLAIHTVGGVVSPAQALMAIVPEDETLEVEAMILNKDIGFVHEGQEAVIKIESFPYTRYGTIIGTVQTVSHDAIQNEQLGLVFQARIRIARNELNIDGVNVRLSSGMNVTAEIKTGSRRVLDYLLSPLSQHAQESMRER